jgi:hypothetical protein
VGEATPLERVIAYALEADLGEAPQP